ncbi:hypothetical protein DAPPUDRAFT_323656 [Daphnia pulex]|uniref:Uncharacterized protein n=1 Tax=Daphnia pulex TaxID=6669 RepID=E9GZD9_DAPPU|nr:hypothetical protein DAPPUDRAFT_323656 [Daphnia pulex]|eukprot:EFX75133.1 hypothetical protein DAPPUDRAFT_323656 [Daphnia pulex]
MVLRKYYSQLRKKQTEEKCRNNESKRRQTTPKSIVVNGVTYLLNNSPIVQRLGNVPIFSMNRPILAAVQRPVIYTDMSDPTDCVVTVSPPSAAAHGHQVIKPILSARAIQAATPVATLRANQAVTTIAPARPNLVDTSTLASHARTSQAVTPIVAARADIQIATTTASLSFLNIRPSVNNPTATVRRPAVPSDHEFLTNSFANHPKNLATGEELPSTSHGNDGNSSKGRLKWLEADVFRLIDIWKELNGKPKYRQIGKPYAFGIAIELAKDGGPRYSGSQIHVKYKNLVQKFKQLRDKEIHGNSTMF